jgi:beta-fructofuranosidase
MKLLHFAPAKGWMNDPNGLVDWHGRHHAFFQYNPESTRFENQHWGHASSTDLLTWVEHPVALVPGDAGRTPYDEDGCFSGCAVATDGGVTLLYTGVRRPAQLPCLARSTDDDLLAFAKDPANPVITEPPGPDVEHFRDHTVWADEGLWWQGIAGSRTGVGTVFAYSSKDLRSWQPAGTLLDGSMVDLPAGTWECPDIFRMGELAAVVVSVIVDDVGSRPEVWWVTGRLHGGRLQPIDFGPLEVGDRLYGTQSYWSSDRRRLMFGWVRTHLDPASQGSPSVGAMSLPRRVDIQDGRVTVRPAEELLGARESSEVVTLGDASTSRVRLAPRSAGELVLDEAAADVASAVTLAGPSGAVRIDCTTLPGPGPLDLFWDAGIIEAFRNGTAGVWTDLALDAVDEILVHRDADRSTRGATATATVWTMRAPVGP